jgi:hypothetical protein
MEGIEVIVEPGQIAAAITRAHDEMMRRYDLIKRRLAKKDTFARMLFILDEFFIFKEAIDEIWAEMKAEDKTLKGREHPCISKWKRMVVLARTALMHMVIGIQRPDAQFLTGLARDSFRKRISLDRATPEAARMMWGDSYTGTDLPSIQGRAITSTEDAAAEVQVLRLLTPSDEGAYDAEDQAVWEELVRRMQEQAEAYANEHPGEDPLEFLGSLRSQKTPRPAAGTGVAVLEAPVDQDQEEDEAVPAAPTEDDASYDEVGVYELEAGDVVLIGDDPVEIGDLHFGDDDGQEWVELEYTAADGSEETERLDVNDVIQRRV